ncbi:hypothetical protein ACH5RR_008624 [Cinchona calisaya]|uniref:Uncharacterized protein n=1 Tax=Cinchona calisaya TaxID=153742 RepID=A0ABD3AC54_9GENT
MKELLDSHKEDLRAMEKKNKDAVIFDFLDSQNYQDFLERHLINYHASIEFESLVEDSSIGFFDKGYDRALSYVKKKYLDLDIDDLLQSIVHPIPHSLYYIRGSD